MNATEVYEAAAKECVRRGRVDRRDNVMSFHAVVDNGRDLCRTCAIELIEQWASEQEDHNYFEFNGLEVLAVRSAEDGKLSVEIMGPEDPKDNTKADEPDIRIWLNEALIYWSGEVGDDLSGRWYRHDAGNKEATDGESGDSG